MAATNQRNYYRLLHVQHDAPIEVITASYRTIMQKLRQHPDLGGDEKNASLLNEAYAVLSNPEKRAKYDKKRMRAGAVPHQHGFQPWTAPVQRGQAARSGFVKPSYCPFCQTAIPAHKLTGSVLPDCDVCDSPLTPVKKNRQAGNCKRALKRTSVKGLVHFLTSWPQFKEKVGEIQNLSPMGVRFVYSNKIPPDTLIKIDSRGLKAVGRVVSCFNSEDRQIPGYCVCVEFLTLSYRAAQGVFVSAKA